MKRTASVLLLVSFFAGPGLALAALFESSSFQVVDPVVNFPGGFSSSGSFRLLGAIGQPAPGFSDSGSFQIKGGFLYFPAPTAAVTLTPTPTPIVGGGGPYLDIFRRFIDKVTALVTPCSNGDLNCDGHVDILDAGILFYWWDKDIIRPEFASVLTSFLGRKRSSPDFNKDSQVDIFDLSILLAHWTG